MMLSPTPGNLGFPGPNTQSGYYPPPTTSGGVPISTEDVKRVSELMIKKSIGVENTRIRKVVQENKTFFTILQASVETDDSPQFVGDLTTDSTVHLMRGDHSKELRRVNEELGEAVKYCANDGQKQMLEALRTSLQTGSLEMYKKAQRFWVKDLGPKVETIFGFLEAYRDPHGSRAEFEGVVAILDPTGSKALQQLCSTSNTFIAELPWVKNSTGGGANGPFESDLFEAPEYTAVHGKLAILRDALY
jgi:dipeptidyl-peptidase III